MEERYKKLTLLHSNDMHGDFLAENINDNLVGGVSMLSGYISKVKAEEDNVLYCVAGDMFRGSVIDSEYRGVSTIEIMNMLAPDVVTIGNHETDYGLPHLLFIEKCAKFPIINANLYIKMNGARLFKPYHIVEIDGMKILFIGILTQDVMASTKNKDNLIGSLIDVNDAVKEITKICNAFNGIDIDFTVLLTHIGFDKDKELAAKLDPSLGVDIIIGGHSHTFIDEPAKVNDILIVQAGTGTDQIGRFDIVVDTDTNSVASYKWEAVPINEITCPRDLKMEELVGGIKSETDLKYGRVLRRLKCELNHESRYMQTSSGAFFADIVKMATGLDICMLTSGAIRLKKLGPIITLQDLMNCFPFEDKIYELKVNGKILRTMFTYSYRDEVFGDNDCEFYQFSEGLKVEYNKSLKKLTKFEYKGKEIEDDDIFTLGLRGYDYINSKQFLNVETDEFEKIAPSRIICNSCLDLVYEYVGSDNPLPEYPVLDRLKLID